MLFFLCAPGIVVIVIVCESLVLWSWRRGADGSVPAGVGPGRAPGHQDKNRQRSATIVSHPPLLLLPLLLLLLLLLRLGDIGPTDT